MSSPVQKFLKKKKAALITKKEQKKVPEVKPGDIVRVWTKVTEAGKERLTPFEGVVIARKHGAELGATITVRAEIGGYGVERIFPLYSPAVAKIERLKRTKVRRAKLYYLRGRTGRQARMRVREVLAQEEKQAKETKDEAQKQESKKTAKPAERQAVSEKKQSDKIKGQEQRGEDQAKADKGE